MPQPEARAYYRRILSFSWSSVKGHMRATFLTVAGVLVSVIALAVFKINPSSENILRTIAGIAWPVLLLVAYFLFYLVQAPWKLHQQDVTKIKVQEETINELRGVTEALKKQIAELYRNGAKDAVFHPRIEDVGRRVETAVYGASGREPTSVLTRVLSLGEDERLPVNHYSLQIEDPAHGEDKFLTVTYSETIRQSGFFVLPIRWLNGSGDVERAPGPEVTGEYSFIEGRNDYPTKPLTLKNESGLYAAYGIGIDPIQVGVEPDGTTLCTITFTEIDVLAPHASKQIQVNVSGVGPAFRHNLVAQFSTLADSVRSMEEMLTPLMIPLKIRYWNAKRTRSFTSNCELVFVPGTKGLELRNLGMEETKLQ